MAARTGHINTHESGAVEYSGHKVMEVPSADGKILPEELARMLSEFHEDENRDHMVWPGMVYISFPTEYGTLYTKKELERIHSLCGQYGMKLFIDGARLGYGLASPSCDLTLPELARSCDVFYIGGTKVGALCGEAVVFSCMHAPKHFLTMVKQKGALLAKGRLTGAQFEALVSPGTSEDPSVTGTSEEHFTAETSEEFSAVETSADLSAADNPAEKTLYMQISRHAIRMAQEMISILREKGCTFALETPTNQQFLLLNKAELARLGENVCYSFWEKTDDEHTMIRLATSWSTTPEELAELRRVL